MQNFFLHIIKVLKFTAICVFRIIIFGFARRIFSFFIRWAAGEEGRRDAPVCEKMIRFLHESRLSRLQSGAGIRRKEVT